MFTSLFAAFNSVKKKSSIEFEQNTMQHIDHLYNYAIKMIRTKKTANNLLQETYLKAFKFWDYLEKYDSYKLWLFRIMRNAYKDKIKGEKQDLENLSFEEIENIYQKNKPLSINNPLLYKQNYVYLFDDRLSDAIINLPEDLREVIILCDIEGYCYEEIADFIDIPVGTVCSRINRGRKMLFSKLCNYAEVKFTQ